MYIPWPFQSALLLRKWSGMIPVETNVLLKNMIERFWIGSIPEIVRGFPWKLSTGLVTQDLVDSGTDILDKELCGRSYTK